MKKYLLAFVLTFLFVQCSNKSGGLWNDLVRLSFLNSSSEETLSLSITGNLSQDGTNISNTLITTNATTLSTSTSVQGRNSSSDTIRCIDYNLNSGSLTCYFIVYTANIAGASDGCYHLYYSSGENNQLQSIAKFQGVTAGQELTLFHREDIPTGANAFTVYSCNGSSETFLTSSTLTDYTSSDGVMTDSNGNYTINIEAGKYHTLSIRRATKDLGEIIIDLSTVTNEDGLEEITTDSSKLSIAVPSGFTHGLTVNGPVKSSGDSGTTTSNTSANTSSTGSPTTTATTIDFTTFANEVTQDANLVAGVTLSYIGSPYTFAAGTAIATQTPNISGTISSCNISPALPTGLSLDTTNCAISGTPSSSQTATSYTVSATTSTGSVATASINITITAAAVSPPTSLVYTGSPYTFTRTVAITTQTPTVSGTVTSCISTPALPAGLSIGATTCAISGTPTTTQNATNHTITASNSGGSTNATISITVDGIAWVQEAYIKAPNVDSTDYFGEFVSISGDTIVVGAQNEDSNQTTITNGTTASADNSASNAGAAYVFQRTGTTWAQQAYLKASNAEADELFGGAVSIDGDTIVVGAWKEDSNQTTITNGTTASSDNTAGAAGAAYVFQRTGTTWTQQAYLKASNAEADDRFGYRVANSGDTIAVGAQNEDSNQTTITNGTTASSDNSTTDSGASYVFQRTGSTWAQQAYLKAPILTTYDNFGNSISIDGDTIAVGASGEDSNSTTIINGTTASADDAANQAGAVYVFKRTGTTWVQEAYLKPSNVQGDDDFHTVSISGDTIVVASIEEDSSQTTVTNGTTASADNSASNSGAVYVFKRTGTTWAQEAYLKASNAEASDAFGRAVSISGDKIAVGALLEDSNQTSITNGTTASTDNSVTDAGAVYVFKRTGTTWVQEAYLKVPNSDAGDGFGVSVSFSGDTIVAGKINEDSNQTTITNGTTASADNSASNSGAVYVFRKQ
ncbi:MAG: putative Ig domain-containing protein [Spirochaetota bacterium]